MSMQTVASPAITFTPPKRNSLTHIPGDEGWPIIGKTLDVLADPKGHVEKHAAKYGLVYRSHLFGETSIVLLGPEANELVLFDQAKLFSSALDPRSTAVIFRASSGSPSANPRLVCRPWTCGKRSSGCGG